MKTFNNWQYCKKCNTRSLCHIVRFQSKVKKITYRFECTCGYMFNKTFKAP